METQSPEQRERLLAASAHASGIFFPLMGPIVVLLVNARKSRFVACHAVAALSGALILSAVLFIGAAISLAWSIYSLYGHWQLDWKEFSIWPILLKSLAVWVLFLLIGLVNTIMSIIEAVKAFNGGKPGGISGRIARRVSKVEQPAIA